MSKYKALLNPYIDHKEKKKKSNIRLIVPPVDQKLRTLMCRVWINDIL